MNKFGAKNIDVMYYHLLTFIMIAIPTILYFKITLYFNS